MTMTSNRILLAYAEPLEDVAQHIFARAAADDLVQACAGSLQIGQQEFFWNVRGCGRLRYSYHQSVVACVTGGSPRSGWGCSSTLFQRRNSVHQPKPQTVYRNRGTLKICPQSSPWGLLREKKLGFVVHFALQEVDTINGIRLFYALSQV